MQRADAVQGLHQLVLSSSSVIRRRTRAGMPPQIDPAGRSWVTMLPAATTVPAPIRTPFSTMTFMHNHTSSSITTGELATELLSRRIETGTPCQSVSVMVTFAPHNTLFPIIIEVAVPIVVALNPELAPIFRSAPE